MIENTSLSETVCVSQFQNLLNASKKKKEAHTPKPKLATQTSWRKFQAESTLNQPKVQEQTEDSLPLYEQGMYLFTCYFKALTYLEEGKEEAALELISEMLNDPRLADMKDDLFPSEFRALMLLYNGKKEEAVNLLSEDITYNNVSLRKILLYALGVEKAFPYAPQGNENLELARKYFWEGHYDLAISLCNEVVRGKSELDAELATELRGDSYLLKGNIKEARRDYANALDYENLGAFNNPYPYSLTLLLSGEMEEVHDLWMEYANFRFDGLFLGFLLGAFKKHPSMFRMDPLAKLENHHLKSSPTQNRRLS